MSEPITTEPPDGAWVVDRVGDLWIRLHGRWYAIDRDGETWAHILNRWSPLFPYTPDGAAPPAAPALADPSQSG